MVYIYIYISQCTQTATPLVVSYPVSTLRFLEVAAPKYDQKPCQIHILFRRNVLVLSGKLSIGLLIFSPNTLQSKPSNLNHDV